MSGRRDDGLRLLATRGARVRLALCLGVYLLVPVVAVDDFWLSVLNYAGIAAIGAIGLNVLSGYTGQISLGHAFFIGVGAYAAALAGGRLDLPLPVWLACAALTGALAGALVGPFALRLRGPYLAIVTLGLVFVGEYAFRNLDSVTGGNSGTPVDAPASLLGLDFAALEVAGASFSLNEGYFWLIWGLVLVAVALTANLVRTRPGRAMQAVRDGDLTAAVIGVRPGRYKVGAFVLSSGLAAIAGALLGSYQQYVSPDEWTLVLSIQYIAIIIVGGLGTVLGPVVGALFLGVVPGLIERYSDSIPLVATSATDDGIITVFSLNQAIFGLLIVLFLVFEPRGVAAIWSRVSLYFRNRPAGRRLGVLPGRRTE